MSGVKAAGAIDSNSSRNRSTVADRACGSATWARTRSPARRTDSLPRSVRSLADHLGPQKRNLLAALDFDPLHLDIGLGPQLLGDPHRVGPSLIDDVSGLGPAILDPLSVVLVGCGKPLRRGRRFPRVGSRTVCC